MIIFVGNISPDTDADDLKEAFSAFGEVASIEMGISKKTKRRTDYGFVDMPGFTEGLKAIHGLDGSELKGQTLTVYKGSPRDKRP